MDTKKALLGTYVLSLVVIIYYWLQLSAPLILSGELASMLLAFGRLFGLLSVFCVLSQLLLIGRIKWIETQWGHDKLARAHHTNGRLVLVFVIIHFLLILSSYSITASETLLSQLVSFFQYYDDTLSAFVSFVLFVVVALSSIYISKLKLKYEFWYFVHLLTYLAILLSYGHQLKLGGTLTQSTFALYWLILYAFVGLNFLYYRFIRPVWNFLTFRFYVSRVVPEKGNVTSIYITGRNIERFGRKAGQFMIFRFLDPKRFWQAHPFSLSWGTENREIRITVKDSGDFTHELHAVKVGTPVYIDGPHGKFTLNPGSDKKLLLIAGGIGITPIRSLLEENRGEREAILFYSNKKRGEAALIGELESLQKRHPFQSLYFYTEETKSMTGDVVGRIDEAALKKYTPDIKSREVYLCGPEGFMAAMRSSLLALGVPSANIHSELFSFH